VAADLINNQRSTEAPRLSSRTAQTVMDLTSGRRSSKLFCVIHYLV